MTLKEQYTRIKIYIPNYNFWHFFRSASPEAFFPPFQFSCIPIFLETSRFNQRVRWSNVKALTFISSWQQPLLPFLKGSNLLLYLAEQGAGLSSYVHITENIFPLWMWTVCLSLFGLQSDKLLNVWACSLYIHNNGTFF